MKRFLRKIFSKIPLLILICAIGYLGYTHQPWVKTQINKVKGMYYIYKGDVAYSQDNMAKTLEYYLKGLELYPGHYDAWFNLGNIYAVYEDYFSAVNAYENAIEHNPKFVLARMNLGIVFLEDLGFFDDAIEQFDEVARLDKKAFWIPYIYNSTRSVKINKGYAYYNKGVAFKQKAMYLPLEKRYLAYEYLGEAIEAYERAQNIVKKNYDIYYNKAVAHHLRGEYREAGLEYCKAIDLEPMKFEAHYNLAVLLQGLRRYPESINELEKAALLITEMPDSSNLQTAYIFNLLNEVSRKFITSDEYYTQRLTDEPTVGIGYTYINGKIVPEEEFDKAMYKNFKTCAGHTFFNEYHNEDEED